MSGAEIRRHWSRVAALGCSVSQRPNPTLHHCRGGSLLERGVWRGAGRKTSDWLVIPLDAEFHTGGASTSAASPSEEWEPKFGRQADHLDAVCAALGVNVWAGQADVGAFAEVVDVVGADAAKALMARYGGQEVTLPSRQPSDRCAN